MRINLRDAQSPVKHQGDRPTCVSFAVTSFHEYVHDVLNGSRPLADIHLSEEFLHYFCKKRDRLNAHSRGTTVCAAAASLAIEGQCLEVVWPYYHREPAQKLPRPSARAMKDGKSRLLAGLMSLTLSVESVTEQLQLCRPVIAVMDWFSSSYLAPLGSIQMPAGTERRLGLHAIVVVGCDDETGPEETTFVFKNSWGAKWGDRGFGSFRLDYFNAYTRKLWGFRLPKERPN